MSLQFIRHSVYTRGLKNFKNRNIPDAGKARRQQQQQALYINPRCVFRVVSNIPHWGVSGLKLCFQFGSHYIYNMRCNRKDRESRAKDRERECPSWPIYRETQAKRSTVRTTVVIFNRDGTPLLGQQLLKDVSKSCD